MEQEIAQKNNVIERIKLIKITDEETGKITYEVRNRDKIHMEEDVYTYKRVDFAVKRYLHVSGEYTPVSEMIEMCRSKVAEEDTEEPKEREEDETGEPTEEETTMTEFTNQDRFFEVHSEQCENNCWNQISDQYSQVCCECPECGAKYWEAGERFDGDANPQYDDDGRKIGSGEYVEEPFFGVIRD